MPEYVIAQREFYTTGPVASPAVFDNMGRYENVVFYGTTITTVEASADGGATYVNITTLGTAVTGAIIFKGVAFKKYRVTATGNILVTAN